VPGNENGCCPALDWWVQTAAVEVGSVQVASTPSCAVVPEPPGTSLKSASAGSRQGATWTFHANVSPALSRGAATWPTIVRVGVFAGS
jgi:hypothetical protein